MGNLRRLLGLTCALATSIGPGFAPAPASAQVPSYAQPGATDDEETVRGRILSIPGEFTILLHDDRGFVDRVELHQGTIINPTGLTLTPGMSVTILGYNQGAAFAANEIDAPYETYGAAPYAYPDWGADVMIAPDYYGGWYGGYGGWYGGGRGDWHDGGHGDWHGGGNDGWHGGGGGGETRRSWGGGEVRASGGGIRH